MADVRLVDLDVFKRYSLAIRQEAAPAEELLAVLDATRRQVEEAGRPPAPRRRRESSGPEASDPEASDPDAPDPDADDPDDEDFAP